MIAIISFFVELHAKGNQIISTAKILAQESVPSLLN